MDPAVIESASAPYESDPPSEDETPYEPESSSEDEENPSQDPSSSTPHRVRAVTHARGLKWSDADKDLLISLRQDRMPFEDISKRFTDRSAMACRMKYHKTPEPQKLWPWTSSEEQLLFSLHKANDTLIKISDEFPERTELAVKTKWEDMERPVDYDNEWTQFEDALLQYLQKAGNTWISIGQELKRTAEECLLRYLMIYGSLPYPCTVVSASTWTARDITVLVSMRKKGKEWYQIASKQPKHDDADCRNYWYNNHWDNYRAWFKDGRIDESRFANLLENAAS